MADLMLSRWPKHAVLLLCLGVVFLLGVVDYLIGWELSFSIFYLPPIVLATWHLGKYAGVAVAVLSASVWLAADLLAGAAFTNALVPYWNTVVRFGFFFVTLSLVNEFRGKLRYIESLAFTDSLTGVANSRSFYATTEAELARSRRYGTPLTIAYLDLDDFKSVNDRYGHEKGDEVLQAVAGLLQGNVRRLDTVARLGGDEFAVLMPETDEAGAHVLLLRLRAKLTDLAHAKGYPIGFSIGVASVSGRPTSVAAVLKEADARMYRTKRRRKGAVVLAA